MDDIQTESRLSVLETKVKDMKEDVKMSKQLTAATLIANIAVLISVLIEIF